MRGSFRDHSVCGDCEAVILPWQGALAKKTVEGLMP